MITLPKWIFGLLSAYLLIWKRFTFLTFALLLIGNLFESYFDLADLLMLYALLHAFLFFVRT